MSMEVTDLKVTSLRGPFRRSGDYRGQGLPVAPLPSLAAGGSLSDAVFGSIADGTSGVAPKKDGIIRVGVVTPTNKSGKEMPDVRLVGSLLSGFTCSRSRRSQYPAPRRRSSIVTPTSKGATTSSRAISRSSKR